MKKVDSLQIRVGYIAIVLGILFLYIPIKSAQYEIPFWYLGLIYPAAVVMAGIAKILIYPSK